MRSPWSLAPPASWDVTGAAAGPAMTVLVSVAARIAAALRLIGIGYVVLQVIIWHSFYLASPGLLWAPAVTAGWGALAAWYLRRGRCAGRWSAWTVRYMPGSRSPRPGACRSRCAASRGTGCSWW